MIVHIYQKKQKTEKPFNTELPNFVKSWRILTSASRCHCRDETDQHQLNALLLFWFAVVVPPHSGFAGLLLKSVPHY